jgi:hypothetical protein
MRALHCGIVVVASLLVSSATLAQTFCNNPNSCAKLGCVKTCQDRWQGGMCLGGYCPKGIVPFDNKTPSDNNDKDLSENNSKNSDVELHLYNVSPTLESEIRKLIDKGL